MAEIIRVEDLRKKSPEERDEILGELALDQIEFTTDEVPEFAGHEDAIKADADQ